MLTKNKIQRQNNITTTTLLKLIFYEGKVPNCFHVSTGMAHALYYNKYMPVNGKKRFNTCPSYWINSSKREDVQNMYHRYFYKEDVGSSTTTHQKLPEMDR